MTKWTRSRDGYQDSKDGRWSITPEYMGTSTVQGYSCRDNKTGKEWSGDSQRNLKWDVEQRLKKERPSRAALAKASPSGSPSEGEK